MLKNEVLKQVFESDRDEVAKNKRQLQNYTFHNFYASPNIIVLIK
jgi:hypothetical protein